MAVVWLVWLFPCFKVRLVSSVVGAVGPVVVYRSYRSVSVELNWSVFGLFGRPLGCIVGVGLYLGRFQPIDDRSKTLAASVASVASATQSS